MTVTCGAGSNVYNTSLCRALVRAGCGLGATQTLIGEADPQVERVARFLPLPALPVWLTAPEALRQNPRIRRVLAHLAAEFRALPKPA